MILSLAGPIVILLALIVLLGIVSMLQQVGLEQKHSHSAGRLSAWELALQETTTFGLLFASVVLLASTLAGAKYLRSTLPRPQKVMHSLALKPLQHSETGCGSSWSVRCNPGQHCLLPPQCK